MTNKPEVDALFVLSCGCIQDGCGESHPGQVFRSGGTGLMMCFDKHMWKWFQLVNVVYLNEEHQGV